MDVKSNKDGAYAMLRDQGNSMPGPDDGPSVNVVNANVGRKMGGYSHDMPVPPPSNTTTS